MADTADWGPSGIVQADGGYQPARPRLTFVDLVLQLWRAKWLMILVGLPIFALGLLAALQMPKTFESNSRLYVRAGDEIRIGSIVTDPSREALPELEQIIQGELELLRSPVVAERTLSRFPLQRIYPKLQQGLEKELASSPPRDAEAIEFEVFRESVEAFEKNVFAGAAPKTPVISVSFRHKDPEVAAEVLNATIASYLNYRAELFGARSTNKLTVQRRKAEADLLAAEQAIRTFLRNNGIGDFNNERGTAQGLFSTIRGELFGVNSRASAVDGQLTRTRTQLRNIEPEINLFIEDSSDQTLLDLQVQREELLSRYREDSRAVQNIDAQIATVQAYLDSQDEPAGTVRRGPNPVYETVETTLNTLEAEADSLATQRVELENQLRGLETQLRRFTELEPEWNELNRNRDLLEANVRVLAEREQEESTLEDLASQNADSVRVLEPASVPLRGSSLRLPVAVLALLFAGFTALMAGLLRALTREGFASPRSLERTVGLPVIGAIGRRR